MEKKRTNFTTVLLIRAFQELTPHLGSTFKGVKTCYSDDNKCEKDKRNNQLKAEMHFKIEEMLDETQEEKTMFRGSRNMMTKYMKPDAIAEAHSLAKEFVSKTTKPSDYLFNYFN